MKKLILILIATGLLLSCNSGKDKQTAKDPVPTETNHQDHEKKPAGLVLDNGVKWKADSITLVNVALLETIINKAKNQSSGNFQETAAELENGLNKMIRECKMQGAAHDALHAWLEPLIEKTGELKKQNTAENAAIKLKEIDDQLKLFPQYFEK